MDLLVVNPDYKQHKRIFIVDTDPSEGIEALAPKPKNITSTLFVPNGGASENTRVELLRLYESVC